MSQLQEANLLCSFNSHLTTKAHRIRRDRHDPLIRDLLVLTEDRIVVSDFCNSVKCFDGKGTLLSKLERPSPSTSMTILSPTRFAYVIPFDSNPQTIFVSVDLETGHLTQDGEFSTNTNYRTIAAIDDSTLAVGSAWWNGAGAVDLLDLDGKVLNSFNKQDDDSLLLECAVGMTVSQNGDIIITDQKPKIVCLDPKSSNPIKFMYTNEDEKDPKFGLPYGVDCDDKGRIYVADNVMNSVTVLSPDGIYIQTLLGGQTGQLDKPTGLRVRGDHLYVAEKGGNIHTYKLATKHSNLVT